MLCEAREDVTGVLPDGDCHDEWGVGVDGAEDFNATRLTVYEAMLFCGVHEAMRLRRIRRETIRFRQSGRVSSHHPAAQPCEGAHNDVFQRHLRWPADLICGETGVATGDEDDILIGHLWT
jgi:hypothetical protein